MKRLYLFPVFFICLFPACEQQNMETDVPACIEDKITLIKAAAVTNPPAEVWEWKTGAKSYYYFTSECCDFYNYLFDDSCTEICAPDGGFAGEGDGKCPDFKEPIIKKLVWKDDR